MLQLAVLQQDPALQGLVSAHWQNLQVQNHKAQVSFSWEVEMFLIALAGYSLG